MTISPGPTPIASARSMDATGTGVNLASLIVPSQLPSASCTSNILAGDKCTRCNRTTGPGNIRDVCGPCAAGGAAGPSTVVRQRHPATASCAACRVPGPSRVAPHFRTADGPCPSCQALRFPVVKPSPQVHTAPRTNPYPVVPPRAKTRHAPVAKPNPQDHTAPRVNSCPVVPSVVKALRCAPVVRQSPQDRTAPRVNPYPAVPPRAKALHRPIVKPGSQSRTAPQTNPYPALPPMAKTPHTLALDLAFTYPGLPAPSPTSAPLQSVGGGLGARTDTGADHGGGGGVLGVCTRFSCGAPLVAHVDGGICGACAHAGFVRPPPAVVQKRVPRRAMERTCPRVIEPPELVRASLLREAVHDAEAATKREGVEDELEVELLYPDPDDSPMEAQHTSIVSDSKREEPEPVEDEDLDLELVYPEDAATPTGTSSSKLQTKSSSPTTLCELFKDGLQTIPALQHPAALADRGPPRHCHVPGCNEVLPAQTRMERCVKCSVGDWKRRKLAATDALGPSRLLGTSSLTTDTLMEEKRVANVLDKMSDVEDGSDLLPSQPSSSPSKSSELTDDHGISRVSGWDSDLTELSSSDSDVESNSGLGPEPDCGISSPQRDATGFKIRIPLLVTRLPSGSPLQKCGNKRCNIALPKDRRWKTCDQCRRAQRVRLENKRREMMGIEVSTLHLSHRCDTIERLKPPKPLCRRWRSLSPDMHETDPALTLETSRPCSVRHCQTRIPLPEVYRWKTCTRCRARARREARWKRDALLETQRASCQLKVLPHFPAHQNRGVLLSSFDAQLKGFVEGQIMYFRARLYDSECGHQGGNEPWKPKHTPMVFVFVGEYSIVSSQKGCHDRNHSTWPDENAELEAMRQEVSSIVLDLERVLHIKFRAGEAFAIDKGGIIMRFTCSLELVAQLRPLAAAVAPGPSLSPLDSEMIGSQGGEGTTATSSLTVQSPLPPIRSAVPLVKTYSGELEAVVVPDESHRLFHGQRAVVRYRMVG